MQREVFLEENNSRLSVNSESNISVNLEEKQRLLPFDNAAETMSLYELYNKQRDNCDRYRLIFNVNPYCTNVLFNAITEPVWKEGSDKVLCLNFNPLQKGNETAFPYGTINSATEVDARQAVKDTEYSHPDIGNVVYHCGYDIFNNHILRSEDFLHMMSGNGNSDVFNTIEDKLIGYNGEIVKERGGRSFRHLGKVERHAYTFDNCMTMVNAYLTRISEENGWYGFTNIGYINIPNAKLKNGKEVSVNRVMNNNKPCEFYDMYPDRSLFSFIPMVNKWRKRLEKNWDYRITYPAECDYAKFNELNECPKIGEGERTINALKCTKVELAYTNTGNKLIRFKTLFSHGLSTGNFVGLYYCDANGSNLERYYTKVRIISVGDYEGYDSDKYFSVAFDDIADIINEENPADKKFYVRREINGVEFKYYLRKFKSLPVEPRSEINKTAYQETIYGDRTAQIVYTDDVDVTGLVDNLGRPLTTLYLTIVKRNKGWYKWYKGSRNDRQSEDVEFSHCFGKVTSGFDFGNDAFHYNIRKMHNIKLSHPHTGSMLGWVYSSGVPATVEDKITIEGTYVNDKFREDEFYGDVACYDTYNCIEYILMPLYHRFNTAQRELQIEEMKDIFSDEVWSDDFDYEKEEELGEEEAKEDLLPPSISYITEPPKNEENKVLLQENQNIVRIIITSVPDGFTGELTLDDFGTGGAVLEKVDENTYTVAFSDNLGSSDRRARVYGTLTTIEDFDYDGVASTYVDVLIEQGGSTFPYEYKMVLDVIPPELGTSGQGKTVAKIERVEYYNEDKSEIKSVTPLSDAEVIESVTSNVAQMVWNYSGDMGRLLDWGPEQKITYVEYVNGNYTRDHSHPAMDIPVKITAKYTIEGNDIEASGTVVLKGEETVWTSTLEVTPAEGIVMKNRNQTYKAIFRTFKNGSSTPEETVDVSSLCTWGLSENLVSFVITGDSAYTFIKRTDIENEPDGEVVGTVTATYSIPTSEELEEAKTYNATAHLKYVPDYKDDIVISVEDHYTVEPTQMVICLSGMHQYYAEELNFAYESDVVTPGSPARFNINRGAVGEMKYIVSIKSFIGDGDSESAVTYSPFSMGQQYYSALNEDIRSIQLSENEVNGSVFNVSGGLRTLKFNMNFASSAYGSFNIWVGDILSAKTPYDNFTGVTSSSEFYWGALDKGKTNSVSVSGSVTDLRSDKYKHFSLLVIDSGGTKVFDDSLENILVNGAFTVTGLSRSDIAGSTWYLIAGRPTFTISAYTINDEHIVKYHEELQNYAVLIEDKFIETVRTDITALEGTTWSISGSGFTNNVIISNGDFSDVPKGAAYNTNNTDYTWSGWVRTAYVDHDYQYSREIYNPTFDTTYHVNETLDIQFTGDERFEMPLYVSGVDAFDVYVKLSGEVEGYYKRISTVISDLFIDFGIFVGDSGASATTEYLNSNYLIGDENNFMKIENLKVRTTEELLEKNLTLKWTLFPDIVNEFIENSENVMDTLSIVENGKVFLKNNTGETYTDIGIFTYGEHFINEPLENFIEGDVQVIDGEERSMYITLIGLVLGEPINAYELFVKLPGEVGIEAKQITPTQPKINSINDYFDKVDGVTFNFDGFVARDSKVDGDYVIGGFNNFVQVGSATTYQNTFKINGIDGLKGINATQIIFKPSNEVVHAFAEQEQQGGDGQGPEELPTIRDLQVYLKFSKEDHTTGYTLISNYAENTTEPAPDTIIGIDSNLIDKYAEITVNDIWYRIYVSMYGLRIGTSADTTDSGLPNVDNSQTFSAPMRKSMKRGNGLLLGAGEGNVNPVGYSGAKEFKREMLEEAEEPCFCVCAITLNMVDGDIDGKWFYGNLNPEGYFYNPHTPIKIRELSNEISSVDGIVINTDFSDVVFGEETVEVYNPETETIENNKTVNLISATSPTNLDFIEGMEFIFYNKETGDGNIIGRLIDYDDDYEYGCRLNLWLNDAFTSAYTLQNFQSDVTNKKYLIVLKKQWAPSYAIFQPKLKKFIWREIVRPSEMTQDNELYDMSFANGRFYIHQNVNFYLRRQDPQNAYNLQSPDTELYNPLKKFRIIGRDKLDLSNIIYKPEDLIGLC